MQRCEQELSSTTKDAKRKPQLIKHYNQLKKKYQQYGDTSTIQSIRAAGLEVAKSAAQSYLKCLQVNSSNDYR